MGPPILITTPEITETTKPIRAHYLPFNNKSDIDQATNSRHNMENPGINNNEDNSLSENEVSPYFQRPRPAIQMAKRKERPEEVDEIQST